MGFFKNFKKQKNVKRPKQVVFEKENVDNEYADFELKIKPRLSIDDGFPQGGYQLLAKRRNEMSEQIEAIILMKPAKTLLRRLTVFLIPLFYGKLLCYI